MRVCVCVYVCCSRCFDRYRERSIPLEISLIFYFVLCGCDCCVAPPSMLARNMFSDLPLAGPNIEGSAAMPSRSHFKLILRGVVR